MTPTNHPTAPALQVETVADLVRRVGGARSDGESRRWASGYEPLDDVLGGGFRPGELTLVGGRPGVGKTVAALQWARNTARAGRPVLYVCYEHEPVDLIGRLLALELGSLARADEIAEVTRLCHLTQEMTLGAVPIHRLTSEPLGEEAYGHLRRYGQLLRIVGSTTARVGIREIADLVGTESSIVFVDYLQKVALPHATSDELDRTTRIAESLKELAMQFDVPVVALAAANREGLTARRMRMHHLRGSTALAYEPDVVILMNEKCVAVSKAHLAYDPVRAERYRNQVVFSVEKNRSGPAPVDLEFNKDFASFRFDPSGAILVEKLVDDVLYEK